MKTEMILPMKKLLRYLADYKKECILGPLFKMLEATFELFVPLVVKSMIDKGIANGDTGYIIRMCLLMALLAAIGLTNTIFAQYFAAKAATGFSAKLRHELMSHIQRMTYTDLDTLGTASLITRMTSDINQLQTGVNLTIRLLLRDILVYKATDSKDHLILQDEWEYIRDVALHTTYAALMDTDRKLLEARERIGANVNAQTALELFFLHARETLNRTAKEEADKLGAVVHVGNVLSSDVYYSDDPDASSRFAALGVLCVEMESAALYLNAAKARKNALAILTVSDELFSGRATTAEERQTSFTEMMEIALNTAIRL